MKKGRSTSMSDGYLSDRKWCINPQDVPEKEHFAILYFGSIWIPGDERSKTNPGHGYPEHNEIKIDYVVFESKLAWEKEIKNLTTSTSVYNKNWRAIYVKPAIINTSVSVDVE